MLELLQRRLAGAVDDAQREGDGCLMVASARAVGGRIAADRLQVLVGDAATIRGAPP